MAETISFDTGVKTYSLNGKVEISFNPTSVAFVEKLEKAAMDIHGIHSRYYEETGKSGANTFSLYREADAEIRSVLDAVFGDDFCDTMFPKNEMSLLDFANGFPMWTNFMVAIVDKMDDSISSEKATAEKRIRKYSEKYKK